ncbi:MAG: hypothetical protein ACOYYU_05645 [Chloroflexota bacterium]
MFFDAKRNLFLVSLIWLVLWVIPWGKIPLIQENLLLVFSVDMFRLGLALGLFIAPGALLFLLLKQSGEETFFSLGFIPIGFALSVALIELIGLMGRLASFSFPLARGLFGIVGAAAFALALKQGIGLRREWIDEVIRHVFQNSQLLLALILAFFLTLHDYQFFIDDTTYGAYLTNWQYSSRLGFMNIVHEAYSIEISRFWLAMFPMSQSLLAAISGVPGLLLLGNYLELFLAPLAVITLYWFVLTLGGSRRMAGLAALIQVTLFAWMQGKEWPIGTWFYQSLSEDKVAAVFLLSPVFFFLALDFLRRPSGRALALVALCGVGIMLAHPVILFLASAIAAGMAIGAWVSKQTRWRAILLLGMILVALMSPFAIIRLSDRSGEIAGPYNGKEAASTFMIDQYTNVVSDVFYGLNPGVLKFIDFPIEGVGYMVYQWIRTIPFYLLLLAGILALARLKQGPLYWYLAVSILLVFLAAIPYTGWILGYFVSARLISRTAWFAPLGLSAAILLLSARDWLACSKIGAQLLLSHRRRLLFLATALCAVFSTPFTVLTASRLPAYFDLLDDSLQRVQIGSYIDRYSNGPVMVIALEYADILLLPSVSANARLISFREELDYNGFNNFMPLEQIHERIYASNTIRSLETTEPVGEKCKLLQEYEVKFVIAPVEDVSPYRSSVRACGLEAEIVFETGDLVLLEFTVD